MVRARRMTIEGRARLESQRGKFGCCSSSRNSSRRNRVDVDVLFGQELLGRGHEIDFVIQAATEGLPQFVPASLARTHCRGSARRNAEDGFLPHLHKICRMSGTI